MFVLSGDVGGTKTYLRLDVVEGGSARELRSERLASADFPSFDALLSLFLGRGKEAPSVAAFGVAGPVVDDVCRATNLPWVIDARALERSAGIAHVLLLNDFHALALGIPHLPASALVVLNDVERDPRGPIAVLGAGTGLGEAILLPDTRPPRVLASEGGHTDLAPRDETEIELLRFLLGRHERVSYERVLSGAGLRALYDFFVETGRAPRLEETRIRMEVEDPAAVITSRALAGEDPACERALDLFVSLYGAEAGNLALKVLPRGGLYVAGGIAPRILDKLLEGAFMRAFTRKGRMSPLLEGTYVAVVTETRVGLLGARAAALAVPTPR